MEMGHAFPNSLSESEALDSGLMGTAISISFAESGVLGELRSPILGIQIGLAPDDVKYAERSNTVG